MVFEVAATLVIGTSGMLLLLVAFVLNLLKKMTQDSVTYNVLNLVGGALLIYYAYALNSYPFLVLEAVWTGFAGYKLVSVLR
ncbi:MAG: hypothetical protein SVU32_04120 [Candidatus Nanohaloarchaea archaeon]|nr:hypothetical protein [Candidatus Nanohaloarchaea archaeon]